MTLIERLEAASAPDRELDAAIFMAANPTIRLSPKSRPLLLKRVWPTVNGGRDVFWYETKSGCMGGLDDAPYTASIDAAMTLVPEGWLVGFEQDSRFERPGKVLAWAWPFDSDYDPDWQLGQEGQQGNPDAAKGHANSPALALCIASLKARGVS